MAIVTGIFLILATIVTGLFELVGSKKASPLTVQIVNGEAVTAQSGLTSNSTATSASSALYFVPIADASIKASSPTTNYGSAITLETDNDPVESILLKFNVTGIGNGTVTNAKLRLYNVDPSDFGGYFYRIMDNSWSEESVTYDTRPSYDSSTIIASLGAVFVGNWYEVNLTSLVIGDGTYGIRIKSTSAGGADYSSKEGANPPQLVVAFTADRNILSTAQAVVSRVSSSTDDAEEYLEDNPSGKQGDVDVTSSDLEMTYEASPQLVGMRFTGITVPQGATIILAYIEFEVDETGSYETYLTIRGEASDNTSSFTPANGNISARTRTQAEAYWFEIPSWTIVNAKWQTPNISNVIQEIVNRPGWSSGNSLAIIINGGGTRTAAAFDGKPDGAPKLVIAYTK